MDFLRIKKISEKGFDGLVARAGGTRVCDEASADYLLNEAVIELKLVEEEGFEKTARQAKLAKLFRPTRPNSPIVVIDPRKLTDEDAAQYYEIVLGPIKRHVKKAADQLAQTSLRYTPPKVRVLVILNVGYTALSHQEFKKVTFRCVRSYGEEIDWVICGGIYYYSDAFDNFLIEPFEAIPINVKALFPSYSQLVMQWGKLAEQLAFDMMRTELPDAHSRMPCRDLVFTVNGVRYVKPAPKMPPSSFWPSGVRPRDNSTGITKSPSVAIAHPHLSLSDWQRFRDVRSVSPSLESSYPDWIKKVAKRELETSTRLKPFVSIPIAYDDFAAWIDSPQLTWSFSDLCYYANDLFEERVRTLLFSSSDQAKTKIIPLEYILVELQEIGSDEANDLASIYHVCLTPGFERKDTIFEDENIFLYYALTVASSYAVKRNVDTVLYYKRKGGSPSSSRVSVEL